MTLREQIAGELDELDDGALGQVARFLSFLRFASLPAGISTLDDAALRDAYAEFSMEDQALAEDGIAEYGGLLHHEDNP